MRKINITACTILLVFISCLPAQFPNHEMHRNTLGVKAELSFRGQNITGSDVPANETMPFLHLAYAPIDFLVLIAGLGYDKLQVREYNGVEFDGNYGFSPAFGVHLTTPFMGSYLRFTGGARLQYFSSEDDFNYRYYGGISNFNLGVIISPSQFVDIEFGAKSHRIDGFIEQPVSPAGVRNVDAYFSNNELYRVYLGLTLISSQERVFLHTGFDASPEVGNDWEQGPPESSYSVSVGILLGWHERKKPSKKGPRHFPEMPELRETAKDMENEEESESESE